MALLGLMEKAIKAENPNDHPAIAKAAVGVLEDLGVMALTSQLLTFLKNMGFDNQRIRELDQFSEYIVFDI